MQMSFILLKGSFALAFMSYPQFSIFFSAAMSIMACLLTSQTAQHN